MKQKYIDEMLTSKRKLYIALTGGGSSAISKLLEDGGASSIFLGAQIPYSPEDLSYLIGPHEKATSKKVALLLSTVGYNRSVADDLVGGIECVGIGATSTLVKNGTEREGREHKVHIAVSVFTKDTRTNKECIEVTLKEKRTRKQEEDIVSNLVLMVADMYLCLRKAHWFHPSFRKTLNLESGLTDKDEVNWDLTIVDIDEKSYRKLKNELRDSDNKDSV